MHAVFGDTVRQSTRFSYDCVLGRASWKACVRLTWDALSELHFGTRKGSKISTMTVSKVSDCDIFCDASDGGFVNLDSHLENIETFGNW
jgi:hypothetical protein